MQRSSWACAIAIIGVTLASRVESQSLEVDARAIAVARAVSVRILDPTLPDVRLDDWLRAELGRGVAVTWQTSDCGESTGSPAVDATRDLPLCVDAQASPIEDLTVTVQVIVGTWRSGVTGAPRVFWAYVQELDTMGELPALRDLRPRLELSRVTRSPRLVRFSVTSARPELRERVGRDLELVVRKERDATGHAMGWALSVVDRRLPASPNFLDEYLWGHGPRMFDVHAWHVVEHYFPDDRDLPVYGYPFEVRVRCLGCVAESIEGKPTLTFGQLELTWRRLKIANPAQRRLR